MNHPALCGGALGMTKGLEQGGGDIRHRIRSHIALSPPTVIRYINSCFYWLDFNLHLGKGAHGST